MAAKKQEIKEFPQQSIDLMFWQYTQGAKDGVDSMDDVSDNARQLLNINYLIDEKLKHIKKTYNGRRPTFDLKAEIVNGKIEIKKITP